MPNGGGESVRGDWNQGPWPKGVALQCVEKPDQQWLGGTARQSMGAELNPSGSPAVEAEKPFTHEQHSPTG